MAKKKKTWVRIRILPLTMAVATIMLFMKLGDITKDTRSLIAEANAESTDNKTEEKETATEDTADADKKAPEDKKEEPAENKPKEDEAGEASNVAAGDKAEEKESATPKDDEPKKEYSQTEVDVLQKLASRREEIEQWAKDVELKENLLKATEQRIDDKIVEIKDLKKQVDELLAKYNEGEDAKIRSLVKIYENMKPKQAASIFEELEMPILLLVVDRMSERKVAPVLAGMTPKKAMQVTKELAEQRKLQKPLTSPAALDEDMSAVAPVPATAPTESE